MKTLTLIIIFSFSLISHAEIIKGEVYYYPRKFDVYNDESYNNIIQYISTKEFKPILGDTSLDDAITRYQKLKKMLIELKLWNTHRSIAVLDKNSKKHIIFFPLKEHDIFHKNSNQIRDMKQKHMVTVEVEKLPYEQHFIYRAVKTTYKLVPGKPKHK